MQRTCYNFHWIILILWSTYNSMGIGKKRTKDMKLGQMTKCNEVLALHAGEATVEQVKSFTLLGMHINHKLTWNVEYICKRSRKCMYFLKLLHRAGANVDDLVNNYRSLLHPAVPEYASPVWHSGLFKHSTHEIESEQRRTMRIIFLTIICIRIAT